MADGLIGTNGSQVSDDSGAPVSDRVDMLTDFVQLILTQPSQGLKNVAGESAAGKVLNNLCDWC